MGLGLLFGSLFVIIHRENMLFQDSILKRTCTVVVSLFEGTSLNIAINMTINIITLYFLNSIDHYIIIKFVYVCFKCYTKRFTLVIKISSLLEAVCYVNFHLYKFHVSTTKENVSHNWQHLSHPFIIIFIRSYYFQAFLKQIDWKDEKRVR